MGNPNPNQSGLIHWEKGQKPEGAGRPKGSKNRSTIFRQFMELHYVDPETKQKMVDPDTGEFVTNEQVIAMRMIGDAILGDKDARRDAFDGTYGKNPEIVLSDPDQADKLLNPERELTPDEATRIYLEETQKL